MVLSVRLVPGKSGGGLWLMDAVMLDICDAMMVVVVVVVVIIMMVIMVVDGGVGW